MAEALNNLEMILSDVPYKVTVRKLSQAEKYLDQTNSEGKTYKALTYHENFAMYFLERWNQRTGYNLWRIIKYFRMKNSVMKDRSL